MSDDLNIAILHAKSGASLDAEGTVVLANGVRITPRHWGYGSYDALIRLPGPRVNGWALAGGMCHPSPLLAMFGLGSGRKEAIRRAVAEVWWIAPDGVDLPPSERDDSRRPAHMDEPR